MDFKEQKYISLQGISELECTEMQNTAGFRCGVLREVNDRQVKFEISLHHKEKEIKHYFIPNYSANHFFYSSRNPPFLHMLSFGIAVV